MRRTWANITPEARIDAIKKAISEGLRAKTLAEELSATRNQIIGCATRNDLHFGNKEYAPRDPNAPKRQYRKAARVAHAPKEPKPKPVTPPKPKPAALIEPTEPTRTFVALGFEECHFPMFFDARVETPAELPFCGRKVHEGCYCPYHARITHILAPRPMREGDRRRWNGRNKPGALRLAS